MNTFKAYRSLAIASITFSMLGSKPANTQDVIPRARQAKDRIGMVSFLSLAPRLSSVDDFKFQAPFYSQSGGSAFDVTWIAKGKSGICTYKVVSQNDNIISMQFDANIAFYDNQNGTASSNLNLSYGNNAEPYVIVEDNTNYKVSIDVSRSIDYKAGTLGNPSLVDAHMEGILLSEEKGKNQTTDVFNKHFETRVVSNEQRRTSTDIYPIIEDADGLKIYVNDRPYFKRFSVRKLIDNVILDYDKTTNKKISNGDTIFQLIAFATNASVDLKVKNNITIKVESEKTYIEDLPDVMDKVGLSVGAKTMRTWMSQLQHKANGGANASLDRTLPVLGVDIAKGEPWVDQISMEWILSDAANKGPDNQNVAALSVKKAFNDAANPSTLLTVNHFNALENKYKALLQNLKPGEHINFGPQPNELQNFRQNAKSFHENYQTQYTASDNRIDAVLGLATNDEVATIGKTAFYIAPYGTVYRNAIGEDIWTFKGSYIYVIDSYDFNDDGPLGVWQKPNKVGRFNTGLNDNKATIIKQHQKDFAPADLNPQVTQSDSFDLYRERYPAKGGDFLIIPNDPRQITYKQFVGLKVVKDPRETQTVVPIASLTGQALAPAP